ncbi:hypothetical protein MMC12_005688 [Toensbergia leucococca]|nr:hypothetical protein [Toensbergia leucococca]
MALNESNRGRDSNDTAKEIDHHKHDQLQKQKEGKGHWTPELASDSETAVAADRGEHDHSEEGISKLQEDTAGHAQDKHSSK